MRSYLLSWNPHSAFTWPNNKANSAATRRGEIVRIRWSTGGASGIVPGDRIFLGKLGQDPIGVIASGVAASGCFEDTHWEDPSKRTTYTMVDFDTILDPENVLPRARVREGALGQVDWDAEYGGVAIATDAADALEAMWRDWLSLAGLPQIEINLEQSVLHHFGYEGLIKLRLHWLLERDPRLLQAKLDDSSKGLGPPVCAVCSVVFPHPPEEPGAGIMECHDIRAIPTLDSTADLEKDVRDLVLVCTSCHAMLHEPDWPSVEVLGTRTGKARSLGR
jgi:5-methylcytosine-specific restriction protein A